MSKVRFLAYGELPKGNDPADTFVIQSYNEQRSKQYGREVWLDVDAATTHDKAKNIAKRRVGSTRVSHRVVKDNLVLDTFKS